MLPRVYEEFERICARRGAGGAVLEIGAVPSPKSLLCMDVLNHATEKVGINLAAPRAYRDFKILQCNANRMDCFEDDHFDTVLCNATFEHDPFFWKSLAEIRRVAKPGAVVVIGTPGYDSLGGEGIKRWIRRARRVPGAKQLLARPGLLWLYRGTLTVDLHAAPGDYYRFSPQAYRKVFFEGMRDVEVQRVMVPPIVIGSGIRS